MITKVFKIECITNMHVGNGDINYNIIDNEVERDPVTGYPTINSSGLKGALREFFNQEEKLKKEVNDIFGADDKGNTTQGKVKILGADMLAIPVRASKGKNPYYLVSTNKAIEQYEDRCKNFIKEWKNNIIKNENIEDAAVDGIALNKNFKIWGKEIHVVSEDDFRIISLPVMARNKLNNGISENLWYEEIVPHKSLFTFAVIANDNDKKSVDNFTDGINNKIVQIGGNASIGYGLCKISEVGIEK